MEWKNQIQKKVNENDEWMMNKKMSDGWMGGQINNNNIKVKLWYEIYMVKTKKREEEGRMNDEICILILQWGHW